MKSVETKNKLEEVKGLISGIVAEKNEMAIHIEAFKGISLVAIELLLAGDDCWCQDFIEQLKDERGILVRYFSEINKVDKREDVESGIEEDEPLELDETKKWPYADIAVSVGAIERVLEGYQPEKQKHIMQVVVDRQPERDAQTEKEIRRQEATDKLHETLDTWPTEEIEILSGVVEKAESAKQLQLV